MNIRELIHNAASRAMNAPYHAPPATHSVETGGVSPCPVPAYEIFDPETIARHVASESMRILRKVGARTYAVRFSGDDKWHPVDSLSTAVRLRDQGAEDLSVVAIAERFVIAGEWEEMETEDYTLGEEVPS